MDWIVLHCIHTTPRKGIATEYTAILLFSAKLTLYLHVTGTNCEGSSFDYC